MRGKLKSLNGYSFNAPDFLYLLGSFQAAIQVIPTYLLRLTAKDNSLEEILCSHMKVVFGDDVRRHVRGDNDKVVFFVHSSHLNKYLGIITRGNRIIPLDQVYPRTGMSEQEAIFEYLRGFFDQRATVVTNQDIVQGSTLPRFYPYIEITKAHLPDLLAQVNKLLLSIGLTPRFFPGQREGYHHIRIGKKKDLGRVLSIPLFESQQKLEKLRTLYDLWLKISEQDNLNH